MTRIDIQNMMDRSRWKKGIALTLCLVLLSVNFAIDFFHEHDSYGHTHPTFVSNDTSAAINQPNGHDVICKACLFGLSHVAPETTVVIIKSCRESDFITLPSPIVFLNVASTTYHLRAPPASVA